MSDRLKAKGWQVQWMCTVGSEARRLLPELPHAPRGSEVHVCCQAKSETSSEEEAELGFVVRAVQDLCLSLKLDPRSISILPVLIEGLVRTALLRAKPDRRASYLDQWRHFLCWLPEALDRAPEEDRLAIAERALRQFQPRDQRKASPPIREGTNCLLMRDHELWYAKVPLDAFPGVVTDQPRPAHLKTPFDKGEQIYTSENVASAIETGDAEYLAPFNPPGVLKRGYNALLSALPRTDPISASETEIIARVTDVPAARLRSWLLDGVSRSDLALLIAAHRAKLTAKTTNLPHLHETLHWARL